MGMELRDRQSSPDLPMVSIIIANYNYGRFLGEAIQSALDQTYPAVEVIVVDDGSTADRLEVAARYPVRVHSQDNMGVCSARNQGAALSQGEYLLFLDSDDRYEPRAVERLLAALEGAPSEVAFSFPQIKLFGNETSVYEPTSCHRALVVTGSKACTCFLVRRAAFEAVGGWDPTWRQGHEDHELWVRMLYHGLTGTLVPEPLYRYRIHRPLAAVPDRSRLQSLKWRMIITYPSLFWRKVLKHPVKYLILCLKQGDARKRHGPRFRLHLS